MLSAHVIMLILYGLAHEKMDFRYMLAVTYPLLSVLALSPLLAVYFLSTRFARQGATVVLGLMIGEVASNLAARFSGADLLFGRAPSLLWKILYEGSIGLALVLEVIVAWIMIRLLREIYRQLEERKQADPKI